MDATGEGNTVDVVLKVGGALVRDPVLFARAMTALEQIPAGTRILIVPGGGPFADVVRTLDRAYALDDDTNHWLAVLAMDQYAHFLVSKLARARLVECPADVETALSDARLPVLAPYRWLRKDDPLPHSWSVTSDSIAAWVALNCGASDLILLKAVDGAVAELTDPYFRRYTEDPTGPLRIQISTVPNIEALVTERATASDSMRQETRVLS